MNQESGRPRRRFWRTARVYFRRFRLGFWLFVLLLLGGWIYLNQVGLPRFIKKPLLQKLRARGLDLQFARLRLRWYQGIVAEDVHFGRTGDPASGQLTIGQVQILLNFNALVHGRLQVDRLGVSQGRLLLPVLVTNAEPRQLCLDDIQTDLRFLPHDQWALDNFRADFAGARVQLSGLVTNASAVADWELFHGPQTEPAGYAHWQRRLRHLAEALERIRFTGPPELRLDIRGDARELLSFTVRLALDAPGAATPWGMLTDGKFTGRLLPAGTNGNTRADLSIRAATARTRWATVTNFNVALTLSSDEPRSNLISGELKLSAAGVHTKWASATNAVFTATWLHSITNPVPLSGEGRFECDRAETRWAGARRVEISGTLARPVSGDLPQCDASWGWWTNLQPYALSWQARLSETRSSELVSPSVALDGKWRAPTLTVSNLDVELNGGRASLQAELDVLTRRLQASIRSNFDPKKLRIFLPEVVARWLEQVSWETPPRIVGQGEVILPSWTNSQPDWRGEVQPSVRLAGEFSVVRAACRQVEIGNIHSHFLYSNLCWHLPDLSLTTPQGRIEVEQRANDATKDFFLHVVSSADLRRFRLLLPPQAQEGFDLLELTNPPAIECRVWGRWRVPERTGFQAQVALTNFSFRGQRADWLETGVAYTNRVLEFYHPRVGRGEQRVNADGLRADFNRELVFLTNGVSTFDPMVIAEAIGPHIARAIQPYRFERPPQARVAGTIPMHGEAGADLRFQLAGGPFTWWKFHLPYLAGQVHWAGLRLLLDNVRMDLCGGKAGGSAQFDFLPAPQGTDFKFTVNSTNTLLQGLMAELFTGTNHLEGWLDGSVTITRANTESWTNLFGFGELKLRDGLIWDIPLFGIFSPVLNGISPGLGNFRASSGTCSFFITNGIIRSEDLQIRSPAVRLQYRGTLDFDGRVNARVEAELLRDVWLVGPIVSTVLWPVTKMFEYKVAGTLSEPELQPVYIVPKLVLTPFHPLRALKSLLPQNSSGRTNSPPVFQDLDLEKH